jgi:phage recombination protein Bet
MTDSALATTPTGPMALSPDSKRILDGLLIVRETLAPDLTVGELQLFAIVASRSGLDPFARQIFAVKRKGRMTIQTGIDGYRSIAARTGEYDGQDAPEFGPDCDCIHAPKPHPLWCTVRAYRKGVSRPFPGNAYWHEYVPDSNDFMWQKMPHVMLSKVAEALALRKAFPWDQNSGQGIGGDIYTAEEMAQADNPVVTTVQERIAAKASSGGVGASLRYFADAALEYDPQVIRDLRAEMFPEAAGVANLTDAERAQLLDRLRNAPRPDAPAEVAEDTAPEPLEAPRPDDGPPAALEGEIVNPEEVAEGAPVVRALPDEPPMVACDAPSPFGPGRCGMPKGHRSVHRSGPTETWPRRGES